MSPAKPLPRGCRGADRFAVRTAKKKANWPNAPSQLARAICQQAHQKDVVISARFRAALAAVSARRSDDGPAAARVCDGTGESHLPTHMQHRRVKERAACVRVLIVHGESAWAKSLSTRRRRPIHKSARYVPDGQRNGGIPGCKICDESRVAANSSFDQCEGEAGGRCATFCTVHRWDCSSAAN